MKNLNPSRMRGKAAFGHMGATDRKNPNTGRPIQGFVPDFSVWYGEYSLSMADSIAYHGIDQSIAMVIFVRHNHILSDRFKVQINDEVYDIVSIKEDDGIPPVGFDLITLKKVDKNG